METPVFITKLAWNGNTGGARRNLMLKLNQDLEQDETRNFRLPVGSPVANSPPGNWAQFSSPIEHSPLQSISKSPVFRNMSPTTSNHISGLASILHPQAPSSMRVAPIGKDQGRSSLVEHTLTNMTSAHGFQQSHSLPDSKLNQYLGSVSSFAPSSSNGSAMETLSGPQFLWGSPNLHSEHTSSSAWPVPSVGHLFSSNGKGHGVPYAAAARNGSFLRSSQNHHVGSAPSRVPLESHFGFFPESTESSFMKSVALGGMGLGHNDANFVMNTGVSIPS